MLYLLRIINSFSSKKEVKEIKRGVEREAVGGREGAVGRKAGSGKEGGREEKGSKEGGERGEGRRKSGRKEDKERKSIPETMGEPL